MDPIEIPTNIPDLEDDALEALATQVVERIRELGADPTDENVVEMQRLNEAFDGIEAEVNVRTAAHDERAAAAAAVLEWFAPDESETEELADEVTDEVTDTATEVEAEAAATEVEEVVEEIVPVAASTTLNRLRNRRPAANVPAPTPEAERQGRMMATHHAAVPGGSSFSTMGELADAISRKRHSFGNIPDGLTEYLSMATMSHDFGAEMTMNGDPEHNFGVMARAAVQRKQEVAAIVASGGACPPATPMYDIFRLAKPHTPVEDCLSAVGAARGNLQWIVPPDFRDAQAGVRTTTCAEDEAGYTNQTPPGSTAPKPCVTVDCPATETCCVTAVSQCVTFGNLNYRVFPEQVEAFLLDLAVAFATRKEVFYLDDIDAGSTAVTSTPPYGASRGLYADLVVAAVNYRKRNGMDVDAPLDVLIPDWVAWLVKVDMVRDHSMGLGFFDAPMSAVTSALANIGLNVCWYYDSAPGLGQAFDDAQIAAPLNSFPDEVVWYLYAPGTWQRANGGTLDVGLVRDSFLNSTNNLQLFSEEWICTLKRGIESIKVTSTVCPDGTGPEPVLPLAC